MAIVEISKDFYVDPEEVEDPKCVRADQFELKTFRDFMLPRLESAQDEASVEVLKSFRGGRALSDAIFDTIESLPASKTKRLRGLVDLAKGTHIYAYVRFLGYRLVYGLLRTTGGPKDAIIDRKEVGGWEISESAPYWEFYDAYKAMDRALEHDSNVASLFEDNPMVEVREKGDYEDVLKALGLSRSGWKKPGLYDFRDNPPSYSGSVKDYEREILREEAERAIQDMWDNETWEAACEILVERANR